MGLTIDLLHEEKEAALARERDPVKLTLLGVIVIMGLMLLYYLHVNGQAGSLSAAARSLTTERTRLEPEAKAAEEASKQLETELAGLKLLTETIEDRFFWAPVLETVIKSVLPEYPTQFTRFTGTSAANGSFELSLEGLTITLQTESPRIGADKFRANLEQNLSDRYGEVDVRFSLNDAQAQEIQGQSYAAVGFSIQATITPAPETP